MRTPEKAATANDATAFINSTPNTAGGAPASGRGSNDIPRDRWGRYLLKHPVTGVQQPWTRTTTMAKTIADTYALSLWGQRMVAKGLTLRPDLFALAAGYDVADDKDELNKVCEQAREAAGDKVAANWGTALHNFTAAVDRGDKVNIPPTMQDDVAAYSASLADYGFRLVPDLIERRIVLTREAAGEDIGGTFDRVYEATRDVTLELADGKKVYVAAGTYVIGDLKTGRDLGYGWMEISIQETIYAHGINQNGVWDRDTETWDRTPLNGAEISEQVGIVVHLPVQKKPGAPACVLYAVDLEWGWETVDLCRLVRQRRKQKLIAVPLKVVDQNPVKSARAHFPVAAVPAPVTEDTREQPQGAAEGFRRPTAAQLADHPSVASPAPAQAPPQTREPSWEDRAAAVTTRAEASAVYKAMKPHAREIGEDRFNGIIASMQTRLKALSEPGG